MALADMKNGKTKTNFHFHFLLFSKEPAATPTTKSGKLQPIHYSENPLKARLRVPGGNDVLG